MRNRDVKSFSIDKPLIKLLDEEKNQSQLINDLLRKHYEAKQNE